MLSADIKFYKDLMEEDFKMRHYKPTYREKHLSFFSSTFWTSLLTIHNTTVDPENPIRIIYQYTSCVLLVILFWSLTYMVSMIEELVGSALINCEGRGSTLTYNLIEEN